MKIFIIVAVIVFWAISLIVAGITVGAFSESNSLDKIEDYFNKHTSKEARFSFGQIMFMMFFPVINHILYIGMAIFYTVTISFSLIKVFGGIIGIAGLPKLKKRIKTIEKMVEESLENTEQNIMTYIDNCREKKIDGDDYIREIQVMQIRLRRYRDGV